MNISVVRGFLSFTIAFWTMTFSTFAHSQDCRSSLNVDPGKTILLESWDGSGTTTPMSCQQAETAREQIFINQLSFLSDTQQNSATQITAVIQDSVNQLDQLRQQAQAANSDETAQALKALASTVSWQVAKAQLLICGFATAGTDGFGVLACGKTLFDFINSSIGMFQGFQTADAAHQQAVQMQALVTNMQNQIQQLSNANIDGSVTAQKYATAFQDYCAQIKRDCLSSSASSGVSIDRAIRRR